MAWGWSGGKGASEVVEAFFAGKKRKRGNCETDGETYWLFGHAIAQRCPNTMTPAEHVFKILMNEKIRPEFEFSFAGWPTVTTCAHLDALGLRASRANNTPRINGYVVDPSAWYTKATLALQPMETDEEAARRVRREKRFVNMTGELFA